MTPRLVLLVIVASALAARVASAQVVITAPVRTGDVLYVTDTSGVTTKGVFTALTHDAVQLKTSAADSRRIPADSIRLIQWQRPDSVLNGMLIGGAIGAVPGIYWLIADPNECRGMCPEEYSLIAIGAVVGGLIDRAIRKKVTVYSAPGQKGTATAVLIGPVMTRTHKGLRVVVRF